MVGSKRILLNTIAVYIKIIINSVATMFATRIVLQCLGVSDFGLYNLLAGVVIMMSFLNGSLMISTQRYMSVEIGSGNTAKLDSIFNASMTIHLLLSLILLLGFILLQPLLIDVILNIPEDKKNIAHIVYDIMIVSSIVTLMQVPYSSAMNAHEDIWFWAITEMVNCVMRLFSAIILIFISDDKLLWYTIFILLSLLISFCMKILWSRLKYKECKLSLNKMNNKNLIKEMIGFVGWNTLGTSGTMVRDQGAAVIVNVFFGTIANAAYGIAQQVNGLIMTLASTITTVFSPSIMQAYGEGNDEKMVRIAILSSKISFLISTITSLPLILFMPEILKIWLGEFPINTIAFCRLIIVVFVILQLTSGLNRVIYAKGEIKWYQITLFCSLVSIIPITYVVYSLGFSVLSVFYVMIGVQIITMIANLYFSSKCVKYNIKRFVVYAILISSLLFSGILYIGYFLLNIIEYSSLLIITSIVILCLLYLVLYLLAVFDSYEKKIMYNLIRRK